MEKALKHISATASLIVASLTIMTTTSCRGQVKDNIVWTAESHPAILLLEGQPQIIETPLGKAVRFGGERVLETKEGVDRNENRVRGGEDVDKWMNRNESGANEDAGVNKGTNRVESGEKLGAREGLGDGAKKGELSGTGGDGAFFDSVPIKGMKEVTIEVIFRQDGSAPFEQRFLHIGQVKGARIMFESRVNRDSTWYLDSYVNLGTREQSVTLIDSSLTHPTDRWYNLTLVASADGITNYVDGVEQGHSDMAFTDAISEGVTSVGVRQNLVCWFKGDIYKIRITPRALKPQQFLKDCAALNGTD